MKPLEIEAILQAIGGSEAVIEFTTTPARAFVLVAQLQLALRHSDNTGEGAKIAIEIAEHLTDAICQHVPGSRTLIEQGWHPGYDVS